MKLVMTLKVRDEDDVLEENLRFHRALGVDFFIVTDNGSVDRTPEILARYADAGLAHVIRDETGELLADEVRWTTEMARLAATEYAADWVFHGDADEFWWPTSGTLKQILMKIPDRYGAVVCPRTEFVGRPDDSRPFADRLVVREARSSLQPKLLHRADPHVVVLSNTHEVAATASSDLWRALRPPGRAVVRMVRDRSDGDFGLDPPGEDLRLVWTPAWPVRILHFPVRTFDQFRRRAEISLSAGGWPDRGRFRRLRTIVEEGRLEDLYGQLTCDEVAVKEGISEGRLVRDDRLARFLPLCLDPLSGPPAEICVEPAPAELERELGELEFDAMRLLGRTQRFTMLQVDRLRNRVFELQARSAARRAGVRPGALLRGARRRLGRWRDGRAWPLPGSDGSAETRSLSRRATTR
ncbi:MAG: glycosyltransferase family 2 protein [Actinomycetota bacterium]